MNYQKDDLYYHDYQWSGTEEPVKVQALEAFRPQDGNTVLTMINSLTSNLFDGAILEIIIHEYIPKTVNTVKQAYEWIKVKGDHYYKAILRSIAKSE